MMKNLLLLGLAFTAGIGVADAQKARVQPSNMVAVPISEVTYNGDAVSYGPRKQQAPAKGNKTNAEGLMGIQIGKTYYDLQSNMAPGNRIVRHSDGTVSAVWTETCTGAQSPNYTSRGIGYNYFNGTTWIHGANPTNVKSFEGTCNEPAGANGPDFGVASSRVGWPEIVALPNGKEIIFAHATGVNVTSRATKGTGGMAAWSATTDLAFTKNIQGVSGNNGMWPRVVSSGNYIHMIYTINNTPVPVINGVTGIIVYSRSSDGGVTWDIQNMMLPGLSDVNGYKQIGGDNYAIAAKGANVAISAGDFTDPWTIWKSTSNGDATSWTRRAIRPIKTAADTIMVGASDTAALYNDGSHALVIDNNGTVHAWAGSVWVKGTLQANGNFLPGTSFYPYLEQALLYTNDAMAANTAPQRIATQEISPYAQKAGDWVAAHPTLYASYGILGLLSMANGAVDQAGNVYVVYAGTVQGASDTGTPTGQPFRDLYIIKRRVSDGKWSNPINISRSKNLFTGAPFASAADNGEESILPSVAHEIGADNKLHTIWMADYYPGTTLGQDADPEGENIISYEGFNLNTFNFVYGTLGVSKDAAAFVNNIFASPNPTTGKVNISIDLKKNADVKIRVTNLLGQEIANFAAKPMAAGKNAAIEVDMANYANGVYLYTVSSNDFTVTNRIVKQ